MSNTFKDRFNLEQYITNRALEIDNLEERSLYKELSQTMILDMNQQLIESLDRLDKKLQEDIQLGQGEFGISITMMERYNYDATDDFMFPMCMDDVKQNKIDYKDLTQQLQEHKSMEVYDVFLALDYLEIIAFEQEQHQFQGEIKTKTTTYKATFKLLKNMKYLDKVNALYKMFGQNKMHWNAVCTAYLNKMFTVLVVDIEQEITEPIEQIIVDWEAYTNKVLCDIFPVWNLEVVNAKTNSFPKNLVRYHAYEHAIYINQCKEKDQYLVCNVDIDIESIYAQEGFLTITCDQKKPVDWELLYVHQNYMDKTHTYPILTNLQQESMISNFVKFQGNRLKTRAELSRIVHAFPYLDRLEYDTVQVERAYLKATQTYDMNDFIVSDLGENLSKDTLVLRFKCNENFDYLSYDIMSFLVTTVAQTFHEYQCIGILDKE